MLSSIIHQKSVMSEEFFEELMDLDGQLIAVHTPDVERAIEQFRQAARRSGKAVYHWVEGSGLESLKASDISVPRTERFMDALNYVVQSMHFGVYLFTEFDRHMRTTCVNQLRRIARQRRNQQRKVILIGEEIKLPDTLSEMATHIVQRTVATAKIRLRDGRWVI